MHFLMPTACNWSAVSRSRNKQEISMPGWHNESSRVHDPLIFNSGVVFVIVIVLVSRFS